MKHATFSTHDKITVTKLWLFLLNGNYKMEYRLKDSPVTIASCETERVRSRSTNGRVVGLTIKKQLNQNTRYLTNLKALTINITLISCVVLLYTTQKLWSCIPADFEAEYLVAHAIKKPSQLRQ